MDSQPDPARPARSRLTLHPAEALKLPGVDAEHEPKPEGPESTPSKTVDDLETASVATNNSEHAPALAEPKQRKAKAKEPKDALISNPQSCQKTWQNEQSSKHNPLWIPLLVLLKSTWMTNASLKNN